jgi:hypothetical protein
LQMPGIYADFDGLRTLVIKGTDYENFL